MIHVPRSELIVDELADLPVEQQDQLKRSERNLIDYLDRRASDGT
jgi:hypothetical protein